MGQAMPTVGGTGPGMVHGRPLASAGARIGARLIDALILLVIGGTIIVAILAGDDDFNRFSGFDIGVLIASIVLGIAYEVGFVVWQGGTPGKLILGLRIIEQETGRTPPDAQHAILRWVPSLVGNVPLIGGIVSLILFILSLVWLFSDPKRQTVYDRVGKTYVVKV